VGNTATQIEQANTVMKPRAAAWKSNYCWNSKIGLFHLLSDVRAKGT